MVNIKSAIPLFDEEWLHVAFFKIFSTIYQYLFPIHVGQQHRDSQLSFPRMQNYNPVQACSWCSVIYFAAQTKQAPVFLVVEKGDVKKWKQRKHAGISWQQSV